MIKSFKHKGLERFFKTGDKSGIQATHAKRLRLQLTALNYAETPQQMDIAGWDLHPLSHDLKNHYAIKVNKNWRITFKIENGHTEIVDYQDYH
ncbi:MAG: type II toxin-antitoxin system RelE/ParE family toxin [Neisseriaceae bacterium]|nr:type II toxin-antitoxin system RelE/ParE family toxin [Neisseriaceae bacterium]